MTGTCGVTDTAAVGCSDLQCPRAVPAQLAAAGQAQVLRFAEPFVTCCAAATPSRPDASPRLQWVCMLFDFSVSCFNIQLYVVKIRTLL